NSNDNDKKELRLKDDADQIIASLENLPWIVREIKKGTRTKRPSPPFTTSTLQQEASKLLGFATGKTMMVAQQLYEGVDIQGEGTLGLVSYIRTDSVRIADEAHEEAKHFIIGRYGEEFANLEKPQYKSKGRTQDAHEAVRPTYTAKTPEAMKASLTREQYRLYKLIWERFLASQMTPAIYDVLTVKISVGETVFRAGGSQLKFKGYLAVYNKNEQDPEEEFKMPELLVDQQLTLLEFQPEQHFTQPPPRYSEASLVKTMEELGIGRPSTYASTIGNIIQRHYVIKENKVFYMTDLGEIVNDIMRSNFENIVDIEFTAKMEESLDKVEEGGLEWKEIVRNFYAPFNEKILLAEEKIGEIDVEDEKTDVLCENCGRNMVIKFGRFGKFLACPGFPECRNTKPFFEDAGVLCPVCGGRVLIKKTKKGRKFYGCEKGPECNFMTWDRPTGELCPECGGYMVEKGRKNKRTVCSNSQCKFVKELENETEQN
ncbi:MAG: type I DNA topoisomerase, partial [Clostridiales bacterium]|nr:type I DNA topoisomerase [Clostridiales bacterium]